MLDGSAYVDYFKSATIHDNPDAAMIWQRVDPTTQLMKTQKELNNALVNDGNLVYFGSEMNTAVTFDAVPCNVSTASDEYFTVSIAWALQKNSPLRSLLNYHLTKLKENGEIERLITKYTHTDIVCEKSSATPIAFQSIFTSFVLLGLGIITSILFSTGERLKGIKTKSEKSKQPLKYSPCKYAI